MVRTQCVTLRRNTERQDTIEVGSNRPVAADQETVFSGPAEALAGR
jgi:UDP-N-acetylglucosamine 2-epimerase